MKYFLIMAVALLTLASFTSTERFDKEKCTFRGIPLWGKVRVVESCPDFTVAIESSCPDLSVRVVDVGIPNKCGEWKFVDIDADFTIAYVNSNPDFTISFKN